MLVPYDISFSGSGFLATYQLGVVLCFLKYTPWILQSAPHILGASAGSVSELVDCSEFTVLFASMTLTSVFFPVTAVIRDEIILFVKQHLPSDAHHFANGRLGVAVTRLSDGKHLIMSEFQSKEDVVKVTFKPENNI
uniref:Patatin-like phospholipase domain-containing protein 2 n=1 Tax=Xiphophorus maculatus TaxID=8083 RepID=A0A3B5RBH4_XIPMA